MLGCLADHLCAFCRTRVSLQVARELSGGAEAQRMKREQISRNANKAAELQAQVGGAAQRSRLTCAMPLVCRLQWRCITWPPTLGLGPVCGS